MAGEKNSAVLISTRSLNPAVLSTMTQLLLRGLYRFVNYAAGILHRIPDQVGPLRERVTKSALFAGQAILITLRLIPVVGSRYIRENKMTHLSIVIGIPFVAACNILQSAFYSL